MTPNCTVKEMLMQGIDPKDLLHSLEQEIENAQVELAKAKEKELAAKAKLDLDEARTLLADNLITYIKALNVVPAEVMDTITLQDGIDIILEVEKQIMAYAEMTAAFKNHPVFTKVTKQPEVKIDDIIINDFLKSL